MHPIPSIEMHYKKEHQPANNSPSHPSFTSCSNLGDTKGTMGLGCSTTTTTLMSLVALVLVVSRPSPVASAVVCREAVAKLLPCELFLVGLGGATPSLACCSGARDLDKMAADSPSDKKDLCQCLKQAAQSFPINFARANQLTSLCSLTTTITFSPSVDCDKL